MIKHFFDIVLIIAFGFCFSMTLRFEHEVREMKAEQTRMFNNIKNLYTVSAEINGKTYQVLIDGQPK